MSRARASFPFLLGLAAGLLVAGALVPLMVGDTETVATTARATGPFATADDPGLGDTTGADGSEGSPSAAGGATGAATAAGRTGRGQGASSSAGTGASAADRAGRQLSPDQGVTATTVKVGFLIYDLGPSAAALGFSGSATGLDPAQQRAAYESFVADINRRGGIAGRKIEASFVVFDILSADSQRAACLTLTEDAKVFALLGQFFYRGPYLCATQEHHRPMVTLGQVVGGDIYEQAQGLLFTLFAEGNRMMARFAGELEAAGKLKGKVIGIVSDDGYDPQGQTAGALVAALKRLGATVGHHTRLSGDLSTAASQIPIEVQSMRADLVDTVLLMANPIMSTQFVREADGQLWRPPYFTSDWAAMGGESGQGNMPDSYNGTLNFVTNQTGDTRIGKPEAPEQARCRGIYEAYAGDKIERDTTPYGLVMSECSLLKLFELGAGIAGANLTNFTLSAAMQQIGDVTVASSAGGSFRPGKFGFADLIRTQRWDSECGCGIPVNDFHQPRA